MLHKFVKHLKIPIKEADADSWRRKSPNQKNAGFYRGVLVRPGVKNVQKEEKLGNKKKFSWVTAHTNVTETLLFCFSSCHCSWVRVGWRWAGGGRAPRALQLPLPQRPQRPVLDIACSVTIAACEQNAAATVVTLPVLTLIYTSRQLL